MENTEGIGYVHETYRKMNREDVQEQLKIGRAHV